ncbi:uncharacterized protein Fot_03651 [Forsythia ovata]|uniref:Uncharacterized protein n=1 Tax=Forsythia ovata TaxID=205694 RepID=A0ABD1XAB4_9LAMI
MTTSSRKSGSDIAICNGLYHGSALGSKEPVHLPSSGFDFLKRIRGDNVASERSINLGFEKIPKGSNHVNLNGVLTKSLSNEAVSVKDLNMVERNFTPEDHSSVFPWLQRKPVDKNEAAKTRRLVELLDNNHGCRVGCRGCRATRQP